MIVKRKFVAFLVITIVCLLKTVRSYILKELSISPDYYYSPFEKTKETFLDRRRQNRVTAKRVQLLDQYLSNNSVFVDGIMHQIIDEKHKLNEVNEFEAAFRNLIGLKGVEFTYKKDTYWRTWRTVKYPDGDKVVWYRSESSVNCSSCQYDSYWVIEENPPCPLEIFSVISDEEVCAIDITNTTNTDEPCPSVVKFLDLTRICDNPMYTQWRIKKLYDSEGSKYYPAILCDGRDFCEISTFYLITRKYVTFRIINSNNHILYSRVMKNGKNNYACVADCGTIDPHTKTISKTDKPLLIDLIYSKNKRGDIAQKSNTTLNSFVSKEVVTIPQVFNEKLTNDFSEMFDISDITKYVKKYSHDKKHPSCSSLKIQHTTENDMSNEINNPFH